MKKFSNIEEKKILTEQKPKINRLVETLIKENLQVTYDGDVDEAISKKLTIEGSDTLVEKLSKIIEDNKTITETTLTESLKYKFGSQFDQTTLNKLIESSISNIYLNIVPAPHDIFSSEDYELNEDTITLKTLNNIPSDYMDFVNYQNASKYFESGNNVKLRYVGPNEGWELYFNDNGNFGTTIDSKSDKYKKFLTENKEFVADFLKATTQLIGTQNVVLDKFLVSQI